MGAERKVRFEEIDAERINIVDADGKIRMAISGRDRSPGWVVRGKHYPGRPKHAGIIFYNDEGEECGGLIFGSRDGGAGMSLTFDQYDQDQIVGLQYSEGDGFRWYGLRIWDRSDKPLAEMMERYQAFRSISEGPDKEQLRSEYERDFPSPLRLFVGREKTPEKDEAKVVVADTQGRPRVRIVVDSSDSPRVEILDAHGKVVYQIPREE